MAMYWLSYVYIPTNEFAGVNIIEADTLNAAVKQAHRRGIMPSDNPEITGWLIPACDHMRMSPYKNRLLHKPELERAFGPLVHPEQFGQKIMYLHSECARHIIAEGEKTK